MNSKCRWALAAVLFNNLPTSSFINTIIYMYMYALPACISHDIYILYEIAGVYKNYAVHMAWCLNGNAKYVYSMFGICIYLRKELNLRISLSSLIIMPTIIFDKCVFFKMCSNIHVSTLCLVRYICTYVKIPDWYLHFRINIQKQKYSVYIQIRKLSHWQMWMI